MQGPPAPITVSIDGAVMSPGDPFRWPGRGRQVSHGRFSCPGRAAVLAWLLLGLSAPAIAQAPGPTRSPAPPAGRTLPSPPSPGASPAAAGDSAGRRLFDRLRCAACHDGKATPLLDHEGSRAHRTWIQGYLKKPYRIRWQSQDLRPVERMPDYQLSDREASDLADHLSSAVDPSRFPDLDATPATPDAVSRGRQLFVEYHCWGCHTLDSEKSAIGPDLTGVGRRLRRGYLETFLKDPVALVPGAQMKELKLWPEEAEAVAAYLSTLR